jgi:hypothetical protein
MGGNALKVVSIDVKLRLVVPPPAEGKNRKGLTNQDHLHWKRYDYERLDLKVVGSIPTRCQTVFFPLLNWSINNSFRRIQCQAVFLRVKKTNKEGQQCQTRNNSGVCGSWEWIGWGAKDTQTHRITRSWESAAGLFYLLAVNDKGLL